MAIKCPNCNSDNTDTARFCSNCATSLDAPPNHGPSLTKTLQSPTYVVAPGTVIAGHYEVQENLGKGGMGEVYRALDKNLGRQVAIKILPEEFSSDPERLARFEREAKLLATLNHPNIAAVHGFEEVKGLRFLVLELVEGETLQTRLDRGALAIDEALEMCRQVAEGLEAAHEKGVVHRDLKPGNIMITPEGKVKILDFGLAKAYGGETTNIDIEKSPTITAQMTEPGVILGTAAYMSPEQARSRPADRKSDIWAFGCVLYECLARMRTFQGETVSDTLAHILKGEPDWNKLPAETPAPIRILLRRCLEKDPRQRIHDIADVRIEIVATLGRGVLAASRVGGPGAQALWRRPSWREALAWTLLALVTILALAAYWAAVRRQAPAPLQSPVLAEIALKTAQITVAGQFAHIAISPDGRHVVSRHGSLLSILRLDNHSAIDLDGSSNATFPTFSPDGNALAFVTGTSIKRVAVSGGPIAEVASVFVGSGIAWGEDGWIYFSASLGTGGIWRVPALGGNAEDVTRVDDAAGENAHTWPQLLPGGKALLFTALGPSGGSVDSRVVAYFLESKERRILVDKATFGRFLPTGHLIYTTNAGTIFALPFDPNRVKATGEAVPVLSNVATATWGGAAFLGVSDNGTLIFLKPSGRPEYVFRAVDSNGRTAEFPFRFDTTSLAKMGQVTTNPRISPDGRRGAFTVRNPGSADVWMIELNSGETERLTFDPAEDEYPVWSPDGKSVAYSSAQTGSTRRIFIKSFESGAQPRLVRTWPRHLHVTSWSGRWLAVIDYTTASATDIWAISLDGKDPIAVANGPATEIGGRFSPDGRWIVYASNESGRSEIYVVSFPGLVSRRQVSSDGGMSPEWDSQGRTLYYLQNGNLVAHEVNTAGEFTKGRAQRLFTTEAVGFQVATGGRFWLMEPNSQPADSPLYVIVNWFEELKRLVPVRK